MNVSRLLPPSERDAMVYRLVVFAGMPTREVADIARVSQTRVRQIVRRVVRWIAETLPAEVQDISPEKALLSAQHTAAARLEATYSDAMELWRKTGAMKYANLALRVTAAQARLPALSGVIEGLLAGDEDSGEKSKASAECGIRNAELEAAPKTNDKRQVTKDPPPVEDCSASAEGETENAETAAAPAVATPIETKTSERLSAEKRAARRAFLAGAQPLLSPSAEARPAELRITPEGIDLKGAGSPRKLSRRERRRLRRAK